jgi:hypothetical protein
MREHLVYLRDVVNAVEQTASGKLATDVENRPAISPRRSID